MLKTDKSMAMPLKLHQQNLFLEGLLLMEKQHISEF